MSWICFYCGCHNAPSWWRCNFCSAPKREPRFRASRDYDPGFEIGYYDSPYFVSSGVSTRWSSGEDRACYY